LWPAFPRIESIPLSTRINITLGTASLPHFWAWALKVSLRTKSILLSGSTSSASSGLSSGVHC
jgi:hypothetical protein